MNALTSLKNPLKIIALTVLTTSFASSAFAADMSSETAPQFSVQSNATRSIRSSVNAFAKGQYGKSVTFSRRALKEGLKKSRKTAAYSNLCAALGAQGEYEAAIEACDSALEIAPQNWHAYSNRAAVNWLSGNQEQAVVDIASAKNIDANAPVIAHNVKVFG